MPDLGAVMWEAQMLVLRRDLGLESRTCATWQERVAAADELARAIRRRAGEREVLAELLDRATGLRDAAQLAIDAERENTH